jgi:glycosyltransferase involved in cell wall biosynthesis
MGAQISIERLFEGVRRNLGPAVEARVHICPFPSRGLLPRLRNALNARRHAGNHVCHVTGDVHYLALALPRRKTVLTIHDCAVLHRLKGWRRELVRKLWFEWPVRSSAVTTVISGATRDDLFNWIPARLRERIRVVPNCVGSEFVPVPKSFNVEKPVFLQIGTAWNKNIERVTDALKDMSCRLEIVGPLSGRQLALLDESGIEYAALGRVDDEELLEAYRRCDALIFASLSEGFGLPVVEAQAVGRPVITTSRGALGEVAGDGAIFVDPECVASIREGVEKVIADSDLRGALIEAGYVNVRRFQAEAIAARYEAIYHELDAEVP